ncbi:MAG: hypothetical protein R3A45_08365 [Bdellovibrionota bacterium]
MSEDQITLLADEVKFAREIDAKALPAEISEVDQKLATSQDSAILQAQLLDEKMVASAIGFAGVTSIVCKFRCPRLYRLFKQLRKY